MAEKVPGPLREPLRIRNWDFSKKRSHSRPVLLYGPLSPSAVYKGTPELVDGWACTHVHHKLYKPPSSWGKYSIGPLTTGLWPPGTSVVGPVVLCGRCSKKRNAEGFHFWNGQYRTATTEERAAWGEAVERFRQEFHNKPAKVAKAGQ